MINFLTQSWIIITTLLDFLAVFLLIKLVMLRRELVKRENYQKQRLYQISILKEVQDRMGYSLDIEKIADVITGSLKHLFRYSSTSSMVIKDGKILFKTYVEEGVSSSFIKEVKKSMIASLEALTKNLPLHIDEQVSGIPLDEAKTIPIGSFFNIPLIVGDNVVGLINVSSVNKSLYNEEEITILYQIVAQASNAFSRLRDVLETEKGKLTSMITSLADGVFMVDTHKNLLIINEAAKSFLNINSKNPVFTDVLTSLGQQYNLSEKIDQALNSNTALEEKEVVFNNKTFQTFITPVPDSRDQTKPIGASILFHDITLDKNVTRIKEDFTHMIVHELRAPLTAIKDSSELMIEVFENKGKLEKEQQKRLLQIIDLQAKNLLEQINQVLDAAKIEAGRFSISKKLSDISKVIEDSIEPFLPQAKKKQILISTNIYYPLPKVEIDPERITQVLNNLISNSLKFTSPNGKITVSARPDKEYLEVSITDNGMGIPENEQKDLFSKYYQIRTNPHELSKKGTGLGLYIVKGIVEAHSGQVSVSSRPGEGTTITFTIPFKGQGPQVVQGHLPVNTLSASAMIN
ncbi:MAG TPA: ATP-binding protein [Candidatus Sulfotelmatobacter sp.]|nr:ATP-binding protein [Candidatus Sulfotelmatobacter sp.]